MRRNDFIKIIKIRTVWEVGKGNYELPNGKRLSDYIENLVETQMKIDNLAIMKNGDLCFSKGGNWNDDKKDFEDFTLMPEFSENEICSFDEMEKRVEGLIYEIIEQ